MPTRGLPPTRTSLLFLLLVPFSCVTVKPVVVDRKTQLENQIIGHFERLEEEMVLVSSVRGRVQTSKLPPLQREALDAMLNREFNRDDIEQAKDDLLLGEGNDGRLKLRKAPEDPARARMLERLLAEENRDRATIVRRVLQVEGGLSSRDRPRVWRALAQLQLRAAAPGHWVQREDGSWAQIADRTEPVTRLPAKP